jgi:tetratricopeptide (TPR) repeat protein
MNRGLHPEAALDMALDGTLPAAQRHDLDLHLASCAACAAHVAAAQRVRERLAEQPWDEQLDRKAVARAMTGLFQPRFAWFKSRRGVFWFEFALAGLLLIGGVAGAGLWRLHRSSSVPLLPPEPSAGAPVVSSAPSQAEPHPIIEPDPLSGEPALQRPARAQPSAAALFAQALALRGEGKVDAAIAAHLRLQRLYPAARETRLSFALAGRLLLERGSPEQALAQFNQYLARPGDVAEEALVGRATALGRLGRSAAEAAAWREVLERHPESVYAAHAKKRLAALAEKPRAAAEHGPSR